MLWQDQEVHVHGLNGEQTAYFGGYGYSIGRSALLAEDLRAIEHRLNNRPRKTLGWQTPAQAFAAALAP
ncbi:hypothetical protein [Streptomyces sp. NPDC002758]